MLKCKSVFSSPPNLSHKKKTIIDLLEFKLSIIAICDQNGLAEQINIF